MCGTSKCLVVDAAAVAAIHEPARCLGRNAVRAVRADDGNDIQLPGSEPIARVTTLRHTDAPQSVVQRVAAGAAPHEISAGSAGRRVSRFVRDRQRLRLREELQAARAHFFPELRHVLREQLVQRVERALQFRLRRLQIRELRRGRGIPR